MKDNSYTHYGCTKYTYIFFFAGGSRCVDAFRVVLNQAHCYAGGGGGMTRRWYTSCTLELQRASLELCTACREARPLFVRVDGQTPRTLWPPPKPHGGSAAATADTVVKTASHGVEGGAVRAANWVPVVRVLGVKWELSSVESLPQRYCKEGWYHYHPLEMISFAE